MYFYTLYRKLHSMELAPFYHNTLCPNTVLTDSNLSTCINLGPNRKTETAIKYLKPKGFNNKDWLHR